MTFETFTFVASSLLLATLGFAQSDDLRDFALIHAQVGAVVMKASSSEFTDPQEQQRLDKPVQQSSAGVFGRLPLGGKKQISADGFSAYQLLGNARLDSFTYQLPTVSDQSLQFTRGTFGATGIYLDDSGQGFLGVLNAIEVSEKSNASNRSWTVGALALGDTAPGSDLSWLYGVAAGRTDWNTGLLPLLGVRSRFAENWEATAILPLVAALTYHVYSSLGVSAAMQVNGFNSPTPNQNDSVTNQQLKERHVQSALRVLFNPRDQWALTGELGRLTAREIEIKEGRETVYKAAIKPSSYALISAAYNFGRPKRAESSSAPQRSMFQKVEGDHWGPGDFESTIAVDGLDRPFLIHIPPQYSSMNTAPLVIAFHGGGGSANGFVETTHLNATADKYGFMVVYPQGYPARPRLMPRKYGTWNAFNCCGSALEKKTDDIGFVKEILNQFAKKSKLDPRRIYATGFSNGAQFALRVGCDLSDRIAAIAPVSTPSPTEKEFQCHSSRPVASLHLHGTSDPCATYQSGSCGECFAKFMQNCVGLPAGKNSGKQQCEAVETFAQVRAKNNGCSNQFAESYVGKTATCYQFKDCKAETGFCKFNGMGHEWPGGSPEAFCRKGETTYKPELCKCWEKYTGKTGDSQDEANEIIWKFFASKTL